SPNHALISVLQDLFFEYPLNNQLHQYYRKIIDNLFTNFGNFRNAYDKFQQQQQEMEESEMNAAGEKAENTTKLYEVNKVHVKQLLEDCRILERIVNSYSNETVPIRRCEKNVLEGESEKKEEMEAEMKNEDANNNGHEDGVETKD